MNIRLQAIKEMISRYVTTFGEVWRVRHKLDAPAKSQDELEFLPAHLELTETPLSAAPKWTARLIMLFALIALAWALIGQMDVVAIATGKTTTSDRRKTIQPLETALVSQVYVSEGQFVEAGAPLVALSAVGVDSDITYNAHELATAQLTVARSQALLKSLDSRTAPTLNQAALSELGLDGSTIQEALLLINSQYEAWRLQDSQYTTTNERLAQEQQALNQQLAQLTRLYELEAKKLSDYKELLGIEAVSQHDYYTQEGKTIELSNNISSARANLDRLISEQKQNRQAQATAKQTLKQETQSLLSQAQNTLKSLDAQTQKAKQRKETLTLKAPIAGTVQELSTHTIGGVVTPAQVLMVIAPSGESVEVEALILNKDIGFVHKDQSAKIKLEAYPYTRYGYLTGRVKHLSLESIQNEQLGLVYSAIIELDHDTLMIEDKPIKIGSGMNATIEIKTGYRRVIDYLLSPLQTKVDESMKER